MIDIHTHILPGVDDGARDIYESLDMAVMAAEHGTTDLVATPHQLPGYYDNYYGEELKKRFAALKNAVQQEQIPLNLYLGMEVYCTEQISEDLIRGRAVSINNSKYLMIEFGMEDEEEHAIRMLQKIHDACSKKIIIAHAERFAFIQEHPQIAYELRRKGVLIQVNKGSFFGSFGADAEETAYTLLRHNLITCVASDAHRPSWRRPVLSDGWDLLESQCSEEYLNLLFNENPRRIIEDRPVLKYDLIPFDHAK